MVAQAPRRDEGKDNNNAPRPAKPGRLQHAWQKVSRARKRIILSLAAAAVFSPAFASAAAPAPPQQYTQEISTAAVPLEKKPVKQDTAHSQERLDKIYARLRLTEPGRELLAFAERENISIAMSDSKAMDDKPKDRLFINGLNFSKYILLNGDIKNDDELMLTLVHELRHSWHERGIMTSGLPVGPKQEFLKRRIQEADAFAFEIHFGYEYEKATGQRLDIGKPFESCTAGNDSTACIAQDYKYLRSGNKPVAEAYSKLLEKTISHVHSLDYDKSFIEQSDTGWGAIAAHPEQGARYRVKFEDTATDAEFVAAMRKVATVGTTPGIDPAALAGWADADFLSFNKTGGQSRGDIKKLDALEAKFNASKIAWLAFNQPKETETAPPVVQAPVVKAPSA